MLSKKEKKNQTIGNIIEHAAALLIQALMNAVMVINPNSNLMKEEEIRIDRL
jgi:hypothetical protein